MADSNQGRKPSQRERKPAQAKKKPETKFPLQYHKGSGNYRKKIKGKDYYFGKDPDAALKAYQEFKNAPDDDGSRTPRDRDDCELLYLVNHFLTSKAAKVDSKEITNRQFRDYKKTAERMLKHLGKSTSVSGIRPTDLDRLRRALSKTLGLVALGNEVTRVRSILLYASENSLIKHPLKFGDFKRPKKDAIELAKLDNGPRMFEADEICKLLAIAEVQMKCMILLGINAGIGNSDIGRLPVKVIDFQSGWLVYPRRKNARERRVPLWQETIAAIRDVMNAKKKDDDLL
ncbi:MAG: hypothetical protein HYV60_15835, partial [Planctomycetia bacterium]|nr:hypothetical protein [Planctomycetia bacterium]